MDKTTHFGFTKVLIESKNTLVKNVFDSVANNYDLMNDVLSLGTHHLWKHYASLLPCIKKGDKVLDIAGGTGDLTIKFSKMVGPTGQVILSDINALMLEQGRKKLLDKGIFLIDFIQTNAESLAFKDEAFDCISIAFGLRNITDKDKALKEMYRVLKPSGCLLILEFSKTDIKLLEKIYDFYSFNIMPKLGAIIANDEESYRYLAESIRKHPDQETLKQMILNSGFDFCEYHNLAQGIVSIHKCIKL